MPEGGRTERSARAASALRLDDVHTRNCRVLPTRMDLLDRLPKRGVVAEIGVASGDFTAHILARSSPRTLHLLDAWQSDRFRPGLDRVRERFADEIAAGSVVVHQGLSVERLPHFADASFDWVYIDTDHTYATTREELRLCARKVKPGGQIAGHDFTRGNPARSVSYGVIEACNAFCAGEGWEYAYLTLESSGYFSFSLRRIGERRERGAKG